MISPLPVSPALCGYVLAALSGFAVGLLCGLIA